MQPVLDRFAFEGFVEFPTLWDRCLFHWFDRSLSTRFSVRQFGATSVLGFDNQSMGAPADSGFACRVQRRSAPLRLAYSLSRRPRISSASRVSLVCLHQRFLSLRLSRLVAFALEACVPLRFHGGS